MRRIHIPHKALYIAVSLLLLCCLSVFGFVASYARMAWKVANYNALRTEAEGLKSRYQNLQKKVSEADQQLATLEIYAKEVSLAYGIKQRLEGPTDISSEGALVPSFPESLQDYSFLRSADQLSLKYRVARRAPSANARPNAWPVAGRLMGGFGSRLDPFSGEGEREFHKGVDISAPTGTTVRVTGDGVVVQAQYTTGGYGRLILVDHGGGFQTLYAHLSRMFVQVGQDVRRGEVIGAVGSSGRTTAPHLHYEVHVSGLAMNPYNYMRQSAAFQQPSSRKDFPF